MMLKRNIYYLSKLKKESVFSFRHFFFTRGNIERSLCFEQFSTKSLLHWDRSIRVVGEIARQFCRSFLRNIEQWRHGTTIARQLLRATAFPWLAIDRKTAVSFYDRCLSMREIYSYIRWTELQSCIAYSDVTAHHSVYRYLMNLGIW